ncbi:hypothetical protein P7K49_030252, partial [Saguinus oedipus]
VLCGDSVDKVRGMGVTRARDPRLPLPALTMSLHVPARPFMELWLENGGIRTDLQ